MEDFIQEIHEKNPVGVAKLYVKYGVPKACLSVQTTEDLLTVHGEAFLTDLHKASGQSADHFFGGFLSKIVGGGQDQNAEDGQQGGNGNFLDTIKGVVGLFKKKGNNSAPVPQRQAPAPQPVEEKIFGINKTLFYGLVIIALILIVYAISSRKATN